MTVLLLLLLVAQQPTPPAAPPAGASAPPSAPAAAQAPRRPAPTTSTVEVRVTDRTGTPAEGVQVNAEGPVGRSGVTDASGLVQLRTLANGTYRIRATHQAFITLEKEVAVRAGTAVPTVDLALSSAPPPPPPPPPPPAPAPPPPVPAGPSAPAGESRVLSIADLAERSLGGKEPVKTVPVGCSGLDSTQLIVLRENLNVPARPDTDLMLYVVAGEAMLTMDGRDQSLTSGWFALVPRGTAHTLVRRGRNPAILLTTAAGQRCAASATR
jgi:mannose-6-phosphate isomerase-like protein (cupin superfamily)